MLFVQFHGGDVGADTRICNINLLENAVEGLSPEMAVLSGMICFRRSDAAVDKFPNNNYILMNISPGHWHVDQMSVTFFFRIGISRQMISLLLVCTTFGCQWLSVVAHFSRVSTLIGVKRSG